MWEQGLRTSNPAVDGGTAAVRASTGDYKKLPSPSFFSTRAG